LFDNAAQLYQEALSVVAIAPADRQRIMQKLSSVSFLTSNPVGPTTLQGCDLEFSPSDPEKTVEALVNITHQMWIDSKTQESLLLGQEAVRIAEMHGSDQLRKSATIRLINHLVLMG